jgi:tetratricopeptide (TPR) repeat protein
MAGSPLFSIDGEAFGFPGEPPPPPPPPPRSSVAGQAADEPGSEAATSEESVEPAPEGRSKFLIPAMAGVVILVIVIGLVLMFRNSGTVPGPVQSVPPPHPTVLEPRIAIEPFSAPDPTGMQSAQRIRLAALAIIGSVPGIRIVESEQSDHHFSASIQAGANGISELVPSVDGKSALATPIDSAEAATAAYVRWILQQVNVPADKLTLPSEPAFNAFADALLEFEEAGKQASPKVLSSLRTSLTQDGNYLPSLRFAIAAFELSGNRKEAMEAGKKLLDIDPAAVEVARKVGRFDLEAGDPFDAIDRFRSILASKPGDREALEVIGLYALSGGHERKFQETLAALGSGDPNSARLHAPDWQFYQGKIDSAVNAYYVVEATQQQNRHLALKIGRIAVLRHSLPIAKLELGKLQRLDPEYGYHLLNAYILAEQRNGPNALVELKSALNAAGPEDMPFTCSAEVYAILNDTGGVVSALDKAVQRGEASSTYVLTNPLLRYLKSDARFQEVMSREQAQRDEIRNRLEKKS